jgi:quercetin dioxygenase-like cupin family protein
MPALEPGRVSGFVRAPGSRTNDDPHPDRPISIVATGDDTGGTLGVIEEVLAPGEQAPPHVHHAADELFYVLAGEVTFQIGDLQARGGVGTVAFVPRGTVHAWQNSGDMPGRMLFVFTPAGFECFIAEGPARARRELEAREPGAINRIAARYQTTYVGLPPAASE